MGERFVRLLDTLSIHSLVASLEAFPAGPRFVVVAVVGVEAQGPSVSASRALCPSHDIRLDFGVGHHGRKLATAGIDEPVGDLV